MWIPFRPPTPTSPSLVSERVVLEACKSEEGPRRGVGVGTVKEKSRPKFYGTQITERPRGGQRQWHFSSTTMSNFTFTSLIVHRKFEFSYVLLNFYSVYYDLSFLK